MVDHSLEGPVCNLSPATQKKLQEIFHDLVSYMAFDELLGSRKQGVSVEEGFSSPLRLYVYVLSQNSLF